MTVIIPPISSVVPIFETSMYSDFLVSLVTQLSITSSNPCPFELKKFKKLVFDNL